MMRDKIVFALPFIQIVIALVTLSKLPEPPPQYFCQQPTYDLLVCNPNKPANFNMVNQNQMVYNVITWDEQHKCTRYHEVVDAIDHEDAEQVVKDLHPEQKVLGTTHTSANENQ